MSLHKKDTGCAATGISVFYTHLELGLHDTIDVSQRSVDVIVGLLALLRELLLNLEVHRILNEVGSVTSIGTMAVTDTKQVH
jgi:hypothetical protein